MDSQKDWGVSKNRDTPKWMVYNGKPYSNGMIWGYPYFQKHPLNQEDFPLKTCAIEATPRKKLRRDPMLHLELKKHWLLGIGSIDCLAIAAVPRSTFMCRDSLRQMEESDEHSDESLQGSRASLAAAQLSGKWLGPIWIQSLDVGPVYVRTFSLQALVPEFRGLRSPCLLPWEWALRLASGWL